MYFFYCLENFEGYLGNPSVAVGFYGFLSPPSFRNGKVVHIKGKPIISSTYSGLRFWEPFECIAAASKSFSDLFGSMPFTANAVKLCPI